MSWVNIWKDAEAAEFVAANRDGNETVPTVVTGSGTLLLPTADSVKAHLAARS